MADDGQNTCLTPQYSPFSIAMKELQTTCAGRRGTQKVNWMWLANVLVIFGWPAVKRNVVCAHDNVLLLSTHCSRDTVSNPGQ